MLIPQHRWQRGSPSAWMQACGSGYFQALGPLIHPLFEGGIAHVTLLQRELRLKLYSLSPYPPVAVNSTALRMSRQKGTFECSGVLVQLPHLTHLFYRWRNRGPEGREGGAGLKLHN